MAPISCACPSISDSGHVQQDEGSRRLPRKRSRRMEKDECKKSVWVPRDESRCSCWRNVAPAHAFVWRAA